MLNRIQPEKILKNVPQLHEKAHRVSRGVHKWVLAGGKVRRKAVDLLHGAWMGHPLHSVLTDMTIGAWTYGLILDLIGLARPSRGIHKAADTLNAAGNTVGALTAMAGLADFSTIRQGAIATGAAHGTLNAAGLVFNLASALLRRKNRRGLAIFFSILNAAILMVSAWLGGELAYRYRVGVNKVPASPRPKDWRVALPQSELALRTPRRVEVDGYPILLYRDPERIYAIGAVCAHEGGPLEEGAVHGHCVTCPWHQSVYNLEDGSVVHGPSTFVEPAYQVRLRDGNIEVQLQE